MFRIYIIIALAVEFLALAALYAATNEPRALLFAVVLAPITVAAAFVLRHAIREAPLRARGLSPESITGYRPPEEVAEKKETSPRELSRSIVERSDEIRRTLLDSPSEMRVEMCAIGYRACVNDMITLTHQINASLPEATFPEKMRLRSARRRATDSLAKTRQALPPGALRATRQEQQ